MWKVNPQIRLSGVCFGHQINCRALGSKVAVSPENWELSHTTINLSPIGQKLFSLPKSEKTIALHQMHQDHVEDPPHHSKSPTGCLKPEDQVHIWGSSDNCPIQGIFVPRRLFTTQGHLGYDEHMVKKELEQREESGSIDTEAEKEKVEEAKDKADLHHDGEVVAGVILRFFAGRDD